MEQIKLVIVRMWQIGIVKHRYEETLVWKMPDKCSRIKGYYMERKRKNLSDLPTGIPNGRRREKIVLSRLASL